MPLIALEDIHFAYPGFPPVLEGATLRLDPGQRLALTGPNGSGKSTLLRIALGLQRPSAGRVVIFGQERQDEAEFHEVRRRVGLVFQDPDDQLFCPTVAEDVAFGPLNLGKSRAEALEVIDRVLGELDLMHLKGRITHKLSGGEKRLVTLATVLAMEPEVLLLDEPTNALDVKNEARLLEILQGLPQAILLVSHSPAFPRRTDTGCAGVAVRKAVVGPRLKPLLRGETSMLRSCPSAPTGPKRGYGQNVPGHCPADRRDRPPEHQVKYAPTRPRAPRDLEAAQQVGIHQPTMPGAGLGARCDDPGRGLEERAAVE